VKVTIKRIAFWGGIVSTLVAVMVLGAFQLGGSIDFLPRSPDKYVAYFFLSALIAVLCAEVYIRTKDRE